MGLAASLCFNSIEIRVVQSAAIAEFLDFPGDDGYFGLHSHGTSLLEWRIHARCDDYGEHSMPPS